MNRASIISKLQSLRPSLEAQGVTHVAIFGSRSRDDAKPTSDLDILLDVDPKHKFSLLNLVGIEEITSKAIGLETNAIMRRSLKDSFAKSIRNDIMEVF